MTTYLYRAEDGEEIDQDFPMGEAPEVFERAGRKFHRVWSNAGAVFYGPGFYTTDNSKSPLRKLPRSQRRDG